MISGVRRRETFEEGAKLFITSEKLSQRLKREIDRKKIFEITGKKNNLVNFILGSVAIQLIHYAGLKTDKITKQDKFSTSTEKEFEISNLKNLFSELKEMSSKFILKEIDIYEKEILTELEFIKNSLKQRKNKIDKKVIFNENSKYIHSQLISIFRNYPNQFFYDFVGKILGYYNSIKKEILKLAAEFKPTQIEIEKELKKEYEDQFIELAIFNRLKKLFYKKWEILVPKQLEMQSVVLHQLETDITKSLINELPFSENTLNSYISSNELKLEIIKIIKNACANEIDFLEFENSIINSINEKVHNVASKGSDFFTNFISNLLNLSLDEVMEFFNRHDITNVTNFCQALSLDIGDIDEKLELSSLDDSDLFRLGSQGPLAQARKTLERLKSEGVVPAQFFEFTIPDFYTDKAQINKKILAEICKVVKTSPEALIELIEKEKTLKEKVLKDSDIQDLEQIRLSLKMDEILKDISRDILYSILTNFLCSISRILELFEKIKKDKEIFLIAINRTLETKSSEEWVKVKIEELIIDKIMDRQREIQDFIENIDPLFINGLIWARLNDKTIINAQQELKNTESPIYDDISSLPLSFTNIPPVSYASAFDMCARMEKSLQKKRKKTAERKKMMIAAQEAESKQVMKEADTLSWIEKKINMSIMRVGKIQPTQLYWNEGDTDKISKIILLHTQISKGVNICPECGIFTISNVCENHGPCKPKNASMIEILANFYSFAMEKLKNIDFNSAKEFIITKANPILKKRIGRDLQIEDFDNMFEGEIIELGKIIGEDIGQKLNKLLYKTWRKKKLGR
ncbi:MAG: hypothetical protein ACTSRG_13400 [Candidatus Helarchaeota archaeon]